jgi:hypothetical protein
METLAEVGYGKASLAQGNSAGAQLRSYSETCQPHTSGAGRIEDPTP